MQSPPPYPPVPPPGPPMWQQRSMPVPNEGKATLSMVMGILSLFCFGALTGLPAVVLGFMSRRDIARSGGALGGGGMAVAGIVSGILGSLATFVWVVTMLVGIFAARDAAHSVPTSYYVPPPTAYVPPSATPSATEVADERPTSTTTLGKLLVIDVHGGSGSLKAQLLDARKDAATHGRTLIVQTTAAKCGPCSELAASLNDSRMQTALKDTALARVDVNELGDELETLRMDSAGLPAFYKIDSQAHPTDGITGDEWDDNVPSNMAPVLDAFVHGKLTKRRHPSPVGTSL